jgi:hypothetical protein
MKFSGALIVVGLCLGLPKSAHAVDDVTLGQFLDTYKTGNLEEHAKLALFLTLNTARIISSAAPHQPSRKARIRN